MEALMEHEQAGRQEDGRRRGAREQLLPRAHGEQAATSSGSDSRAPRRRRVAERRVIVAEVTDARAIVFELILF